jgi:DNA-binding Lrp family transcriptional regulator
MRVIRNVFKCKPGKAKELIEKLKKANGLMKGAGAVINERVLVDEVATFWTVVIETEVEDMAKFEESMKEYGSREDVQQAMAGYMDLVDGGYREIFRIA